MKKIIVFTGEMRRAFEYEFLKQIIKYDWYEIDYYVMDKNHDYFNGDDKFFDGFNSINFIFNCEKADIWTNNIVMFFYFIPYDDLFIDFKSENRFCYIWNIYPYSIEGQRILSKKIKLEIYNFYWNNTKNTDIPKILKKSFPKTKKINCKNISFPSWIAGMNNFDFWFGNRYIYDIIITLWWATDFEMIDSVIDIFSDKKILIVWKNHPNFEVKNNLEIINSWKEYKNVSVIDMVNEKRLFMLFRLSKIWFLPFGRNHDRHITRVSDMVYMWKILFTSKIDATWDIENVVFCRGKDDFIRKIRDCLDGEYYRDKEVFEKIRRYYNDNFRMRIILDEVLE